MPAGEGFASKLNIFKCLSEADLRILMVRTHSRYKVISQINGSEIFSTINLEKKNPNSVYKSNMRFPVEGITVLFVIQHSEETSLGFALYED